MRYIYKIIILLSFCGFPGEIFPQELSDLGTINKLEKSPQSNDIIGASQACLNIAEPYSINPTGKTDITWEAPEASSITPSANNSECEITWNTIGKWKVKVNYKTIPSGTLVVDSIYVDILTAPEDPAVSEPFNINCVGFAATWNESEFATSYLFDLSTFIDFTGFVSGYQNLVIENDSIVVTGLSPGVTYFYRVREINKCGTSNYSDTVTCSTKSIPSKPEATSATAVSCNQFTANWNNSSFEDTYQLYYSTDSTFQSSNTDSIYTNMDSISAIVEDLPPGTTYFYRVKAINDCGISEYSDKISVTTDSETAITKQPLEIVEIDEGEKTYISLTATGTNLTYEWQVSVDCGVNFKIISEAGSSPQYVNWDSDSLEIKNTKIDHSYYSYRCIIRGSCPSEVFSDTTKLIVNSSDGYSLIATATPDSVCAGESTQLKATIKPSSNYSYVWSTNSGSTIIEGDSPEVNPGFTTTYKVSVKKCNTQVAESTVKVVVNPIPQQPSITGDPSFCTNQQGVLYKTEIIDPDLKYYWNILPDDSKVAHSITTDSPYLIINYNKDIQENFMLQLYTINNYKCSSEKSSFSPSKNGEAPDVSNYGDIIMKGSYILICDPAITGIANWGKTSLVDLKDGILQTAEGKNYHDYYPDSINTSEYLYWVETKATDNSCPSRYYYNVPFTKSASNSAELNPAIIELYPNPASDLSCFNIPGDLTYPCNLKYYNASGQLIKELVIPDVPTVGYCNDVSGFAPGFYTIKVSDTKGRFLTGKLIVK
jgi:hypothetical protein